MPLIDRLVRIIFPTEIKNFFKTFTERIPHIHRPESRAENTAGVPAQKAIRQWVGLGYYSAAHFFQQLRTRFKHVMFQFQVECSNTRPLLFRSTNARRGATATATATASAATPTDVSACTALLYTHPTPGTAQSLYRLPLLIGLPALRSNTLPFLLWRPNGNSINLTFHSIKF